MLRYLFRRLLLILPTLLIITLITFSLNKCAPGDPVRETYGQDLSTTFDPEAHALVYGANAGKLGLDKPDFYFSVTTSIFPDTLYRVFPPERRRRMSALAAASENWPAVDHYEKQLAKTIRVMERMPDSLPQKTFLRSALNNLLSVDRLELLPAAMSELNNLAPHPDAPAMDMALDSLRAGMLGLQVKPATAHFTRPVFHWYGLDNQYHRWLTGLFSGRLGTSFSTKKPVGSDLYYAFWPTLFITGSAILLAYLLAIPLGIFMARHRHRRWDRWAQRGLLLLYAMPVFWLGNLLILGLATPGYGLHWVNGITLEPWQGSGKTFFHWVSSNAGKFPLPILTLTVHALAILALQLRGGLLEALSSDYIRTARAKGATESVVLWRHGFRNALFPLITVLAGVFPTLLAGSLVVEYLFQYPGMGIKTQEAFLARDFPVLSAILLLSALLTVLGNVVSDVLFGWADPRVRFTRRSG